MPSSASGIGSAAGSPPAPRPDLLGRILPEPVVVDEAFDDDDAEPLHPEEAAAVARAVPARRQEFATVRTCARRGLRRLGVPPVSIPPGPDRAPQWPAGIVGSMTHCSGYRACAVARAEQVTTLGIDAEPHAPLPPGVLARVAVPEELRHIAALADADPALCWDRLLFCAKESLYKAWFPLTRRWLGFEDVLVAVDPRGWFSARLIERGPDVPAQWLPELRGRWAVGHQLAVAAVCA